MTIILLMQSLVLAQGQGITIDEQAILPYWKNYTQTHASPARLEEKRDILMNCLGDHLMIKRAQELGIENTKEFQAEWREAEEEAKARCERESINSNRCQGMIESIRKILLTRYVMEKEVVPKIKVKEEEVDQLVYSHRGKKRGKSLDREKAKLFLVEKNKGEALTSYVRELMERYHVSIDNHALMKLNLSP